MDILRKYMWLWVICGMIFVSAVIVLIFLLINKCISRAGKHRITHLERGPLFSVESNKYHERNLDNTIPPLPPRTQFLTAAAQSYENLAEAPNQEQLIDDYEQANEGCDHNADDYEQPVPDYVEATDDCDHNIDDYEQALPDYIEATDDCDHNIDDYEQALPDYVQATDENTTGDYEQATDQLNTGDYEQATDQLNTGDYEQATDEFEHTSDDYEQAMEGDPEPEDDNASTEDYDDIGGEDENTGEEDYDDVG